MEIILKGSPTSLSRIPSTGLVKPFQVLSAGVSQIIAESIDTLSLPVNKALDLILSNAYGQTAYPVTFTLQNNAVTTATIQDGAVTTSKIPNGAVTLSKLSPIPETSPNTGDVITWGGTGFILSPVVGGGPGGGISSITTGTGIIPAIPNPITTLGTIAADTSTTGDPSLTKIPFFNSSNQIELDGASTPPAKILFNNTVDYTIFNDGDFTIRDETSSRDILTIDATKVSINDPLYVNGQLVCTTSAASCSLTGSTLSGVTALPPLNASDSQNHFDRLKIWYT